MKKELEQFVSMVTESPAYKEAISSDTIMRLRSGARFEGEILPDVLRRALEEAYQAGLRRAVEAVENWDALEHDSTVGFAWRNLIREKVVSRIQVLTALSEEIKNGKH